MPQSEDPVKDRFRRRGLREQTRQRRRRRSSRRAPPPLRPSSRAAVRDGSARRPSSAGVLPADAACKDQAHDRIPVNALRDFEPLIRRRVVKTRQGPLQKSCIDVIPVHRSVLSPPDCFGGPSVTAAPPACELNLSELAAFAAYAGLVHM